MKQGGVRHTILSARGKLKGNALRAFATQYPEYTSPQPCGPKADPMKQDQASITSCLRLLRHGRGPSLSRPEGR
jgi:hypothetical protein